MNPSNACAEFELLLQADVDGELDAARAAAVTAHRSQCPHCAAVYQELLDLHERLRRELQPERASGGFRTAIAARVAAAQAVTARALPAAANEPARAAASLWYRRLWLPLTGAFGAGGFATAAVLLLLLNPHAGAPGNEIVSSHIRALQPGHLVDVVSTDQHTVKPWFEGRLDFSPPVKNLAGQGFPLIGGRLDYLGNRTVAVMVYQRARHPINLYAWPSEKGDSGTVAGMQKGFNLQHWTQDGMELWAVSDLNAKELGEFVGMWRGM